MASHETWVPTVMLGYFNVDGKLLLHQLWITELGSTEWRQVKIMSASHKNRPSVETLVFNDNEWGDDGTIRPMSQILPGD